MFGINDLEQLTIWRITRGMYLKLILIRNKAFSFCRVDKHFHLFFLSSASSEADCSILCLYFIHSFVMLSYGPCSGRKSSNFD